MKRVLVVDDDLCILQVAKTILERSGFRTLCADNGLKAIRLLQTNEIDVLLTDMVMPGMSGGELIVEARRSYPDLPVCCMTAYIPRLDTDLDGVPIIFKPFTPGRLIKTVRQVLETRQQRRDQMGASSSGSMAVPENQIHERQTSAS
jgi:two-component system, cell cycle sensor histidine kinase and response regulator CckA